ncbi:putative metallopeptidase-like protein [Phytobacter diazotrophicus]|nr:putative metallopeptidase-like protein [Phytobacter diazotrophicus]
MKRKTERNPALDACQAGLQIIAWHPLFSPIFAHIYVRFDHTHAQVSAKNWLAISNDGYLWLNAKRHARPEQWARMVAQALAALGFGYITPRTPAVTWELAVLISTMHFCEGLKIGPLPEELQSYLFPQDIHSDAELLFRQLQEEGISESLARWQAIYCGEQRHFVHVEKSSRYHSVNWQELLADGLSNSVSQALEQVGGYQPQQGQKYKLTLAQKARQQIMTLYPLLGALAAGFDIEEDAKLCSQYDIAVAAIDVGIGKIWINPTARLNQAEMLFVFAHELLHAGLNHASRRRGRDAELWNVACDFIINDWLIEMQVGAPPELGLLYDAQFKGMSAEEIYDSLAMDMRRSRKLITLRGRAGGDILGEDGDPRFMNAEAYCRRALYQGMERCLYGQSRGALPAGLIEAWRNRLSPGMSPWLSGSMSISRRPSDVVPTRVRLAVRVRHRIYPGQLFKPRAKKKGIRAFLASFWIRPDRWTLSCWARRLVPSPVIHWRARCLPCALFVVMQKLTIAGGSSLNNSFTILRCKGEAVPSCSRVLNYWIAWRCAEIFHVEGHY